MVIAPSINTGTFGVAPDAGVASATVTVGQQLGASIGTSLLNTIFASAVASYLVTHESSTRFITRAALNNAALAHGYYIAFWWTRAITAGGAAIAALLLRPGPLAGPAATGPQKKPPVSRTQPVQRHPTGAGMSSAEAYQTKVHPPVSVQRLHEVARQPGSVGSGALRQGRYRKRRGRCGIPTDRKLWRHRRYADRSPSWDDGVDRLVVLPALRLAQRLCRPPR